MAELKNKKRSFRLLKIRHLASISGLQYTKLLNCIGGLYNSLTEAERTRVYNNMMEEVEKAASALGFTVDGRRLKAKD